jgi:phage terminase small subunit
MAVKKDDPNRALTLKQQAAVDHYRVHGDKSAAYRAAYDCKRMKTSTVNRTAKALFDKPHIAAIMAQAREVQAQKLDISENRILAEMAAIGFSNAASLFNKHGAPKNISDMDVPTQRAIKKVVTKRYIERTGAGKDDYEEVEVQMIELHPKLPALQKIAEIKGMCAQKDTEKHRPVNVNVNITGKSLSIKEES